MTMISSSPARSVAGAGFAGRLAMMGDSIAVWWLRREAIKALQSLDDRQLRDIGLARVTSRRPRRATQIRISPGFDEAVQR